MSKDTELSNLEEMIFVLAEVERNLKNAIWGKAFMMDKEVGEHE